MHKNTLALLLSIIFLQACATSPQTPISVNPQFWEPSNKKVIVVVDEIPSTTVAVPGAECLLCLAAARGVVSGVTKHFESLVPDELQTLSKDLIETLRQRGITAGLVRDPLVFNDLPKFGKSDIPSPRRDFRTFAEKHNASHILFVDINQQGAQRSFANYVPTEQPSAIVRGEAMLINASTNAYEWYLPIDNTQTATGKWKEPPNYPGLTNAYFQVIARTKDQILSALGK